MRQRLVLLAFAVLAAAPARAAGDEAKPLPKLTFEAEALSDYRFRGVSLSGREPVLQAEALLEFDSGVWASAWGSTLSGTDVELQLGIGYSKDTFSRLNLEMSLNYYAYLSDASSNYFEGAASLSYPFRALTPKMGLQYAPPQDHLRDEAGARRDNLYAYFALEIALRKAPITLDGQLGYETGLFDTRAAGGKWDWRVGAKARTRWLDFGLAYVDSTGRLRSGSGRNLAGEQLVASVGKSF